MTADLPPDTSEPPAPAAATSGRITKWIGPLAILVVLAAAGWVLHRELRVVHYRDLAHQFSRLPRTRIVESLLLALAAYAVLPGYDFITDASLARDSDGRDPNPRDEGDWRDDGGCGGFPASPSS
jgi:hypothetical protein